MDTAATLDQYTQDISNLPAELQHILVELGTGDTNLYEIRKKISQKDSAIHKFIKQHGSLTKNPKENQLYPKIREDFKKAEQLQKEKCIVANTALFLTAKHLIKLEGDLEKLRNEGLLVVEDMDFDIDEELFSSRATSRTGTEALTNNFTSTNGKRGSTSVQETTPVAIPSLSTTKKTSRKITAPKASTPNVGVNISSIASNNTVNNSVKSLKRQRIDDSKTPEPSVEPSIPSSLSRVYTKSPKIESLRNDNAGNGSVHVNGSSAGGAGDEENELYCFCQRVSFGEMVGCDNDDCKYEWFHYECVGLKEPPKGKWFCPDCVERQKNKDKKKRKL